MTDETLADALRQHGYRVTPPRRLVWDVLRRADRHLTAEEVAEQVAELRGAVNIASVYRALAVLADLELVRESRLGEASTGPAYWEVAHPDEHFHLVCDVCGDVSHHRGRLVEEIATHLRDGHGFAPSQVDLVVTGTCAACQAAAS